MHVRNWSALLCFGLAGVGCGGLQGDALSGGPSPAEALPVATVADDAREVTAQACPPGVATPVATLQPPGQVDFMGELTDVQGTLYFVTSTIEAGSVLWRSNGTAAGTVPVKSFPGPPGVYQPQRLVAVGDKLFFQVRTDANGFELWSSDGTAGGTRLVKDLTPGAEDSLMSNATEVDGRLVFFRWVPLPGDRVGPELWRSDGTAAGTLLVRDFTSTPGLAYDTLKVGDALLFFISEDTGTTLWRTDGTAAGTTSVKRLDAGRAGITGVSGPGEQPLFIVEDGPNSEVWKTNGTAAGTVRLDAFGKRVRLLGTLGTSVYLTSMDSPVTKRLRIDRLSLAGGGKTGITTLPNPYGSYEYTYPSVPMAVVSGGDIYFSVAIGSDAPVPTAISLWATNGTAAGTRQLLDNGNVEYGYRYPVVATGTGQVLFGGAPDPLGPAFPYFTRGTAATQGRLADVTFPNAFTRVGNRIFFTAIATTGEGQLWSVPATFSCPPGLTGARE